MTVLGRNSIKVEWTLPTTPNGEITNYQIHTSQAPGAAPAFEGLLPADGLEIELNDLSADTVLFVDRSPKLTWRDSSCPHP